MLGTFDLEISFVIDAFGVACFKAQMLTSAFTVFKANQPYQLNSKSSSRIGFLKS